MKWRIIAILAILFLAIVLAAIIIVILNSGEVNEYDDRNDLHSNATSRGHFGDDEPKTTKGIPASGDSHFVRFSTIPTTVIPITELLTGSEESDLCDSDPSANTCQRPQQNIRKKVSEEIGNDSAVFRIIKPIEYALNVSISDSDEKRFKGKLIVWVEITKDTNQILLQSGTNVQILEEQLVSVFSCTDEVAICVQSVTRYMDDGYVLVKLSRSVGPGAVLRVAINRFETALTPTAGGFLLQQPQKWERDRARIVGTLNTAPTPSVKSSTQNYLHNVFPLIASAVERKSTFKLCIEHPRSVIARSNTPKRVFADLPNDQAVTCFQTTPKISLDSFAFVIFDNLQLISSSNPTELPDVEAYVGKHLSKEDSQWLIDETHQVLNKMAEITRVKYPLEKLTIMSSPLSAFDDGVAALGLVHIKETWVEHPKYAFTHNVLIAQLVRQWLANTVTFCDKCFQDGLVSYLEWHISAKLENKVVAADEFSTNSTRRFIEARNRLLQSGSSTTSTKFLIGSLKPANDCADRVAVVFFMLENFYSFSVLENLVSHAVRDNAWAECITSSRLSELFSQVTGGSEIARKVFESFVGEKSFESPPLLRISVSDGTLTISQVKNSADENAANRAVPLQITDDSQHRTELILTNSDVTSQRAVKFVIAEPNSYVRHIYNPENYENILDCYGRNCPALSYDALSNALSDLCWALLSNRIEADRTTRPSWLEIFKKLSTERPELIRDANCLCCLQGRTNAKAQCRWTWRDTCSKVSILNNN